MPIDLTKDSGDYDNSSDLQTYLRFEEGSGTTASDTTSNGNDGTLTNGIAYSTTVPE